MISFFSHHRKVIFAVVTVIFVGSMFFVSGQVFTGTSDAVAEVGGRKIPYQQFLTQVNRVMASVKDSGTEVNEILSKRPIREK